MNSLYSLPITSKVYGYAGVVRTLTGLDNTRLKELAEAGEIRQLRPEGSLRPVRFNLVDLEAHLRQRNIGAPVADQLKRYLSGPTEEIFYQFLEETDFELVNGLYVTRAIDGRTGTRPRKIEEALYHPAFVTGVIAAIRALQNNGESTTKERAVTRAQELSSYFAWLIEAKIPGVRERLKECTQEERVWSLASSGSMVVRPITAEELESLEKRLEKRKVPRGVNLLPY